MSEIEFNLKNYERAYEYLSKYINLFNKHNSAEKTANLLEIEEKNLKKQKQLEIDLINEQKKNETKIKNISLIALCISAILICGIVYFLVKLKKSNNIIIAKNREVELQKISLQEKQKEIIDSLNYAKRIQEAQLPNNKQLDRIFSKLKKS